MNKADLIDTIAAATSDSKAGAARALEAVIDAIGQGLAASGQVQLTGFGTFKIVQRAARTGRNPRTGEPIEIAASKSVKFTPSQALKGSL